MSGVEDQWKLSFEDGRCGGELGCYHYYMSDETVSLHGNMRVQNIAYHRQHSIKMENRGHFYGFRPMKSGGRRENEPIFSEKMEEKIPVLVFFTGRNVDGLTAM